MNKLSIDFFERNSVTVAKELLGKILVHNEIELLITETEAYGNETDLASHARFGKTERSKIMYGKAGTLYIYLIYGMYYLANIITGKVNEPGAVLIKKTKILKGQAEVSRHLANHKKIKYNDEATLNGPGILSAALGFTKLQNGQSLLDNDNTYIKEPVKFENLKISTGKRIGIDYAGDSKDLPWRFTLDV